jgi:hypothetical protein
VIRRFTARTLTLDVGAIFALAVCALVLHRDGLFGGPAFDELDTRLFYFPLAAWVGQQLQSGTYPFWLPGIFTGYPIFADGELGLAYLPQVLLLYLLPPPLAIVWLRVLHAFLAGLFTYLYLKTLRLAPLPALGGALVFAFGSFLTAQMHHENVVRSAVWLPAVLACFVRASACTTRWRLCAWSALGALALAQSALGLHVQPVLMLGLALALCALFFALTPGQRPFWALASAAAIVLGAIALAAVQLLPLAEWALVSSRRGGVDYEFASAFALSPENLPTLIFPYFFRLPDATTWWTLWQQWETEVYVGIPTLALVLVGIVFARRMDVLYFVVLGTVALLVAMANYAPVFNLHQVLWSIPGFSFLRAPARFTYLFVFACACLAGFGLQALTQRRLRIVLALVGAVPSVALLAALLALLPSWRAWLMSDPARATAFANSAYLATRAQYPIDPQLVVSGVVSSLDLANPKTAWSLGLLALTSVCFVGWLALGHRRASLGQALFVALMAADLLAFAADFHPRAPLANLMPPLPAGVGPGARVLLHDPTDLPMFEPNQLLADGVGTTQGYSSLPSQRHVEMDASTSTQPDLLDLWSAPLVLEPTNPSDLHEVSGVRFRANHSLAAGFGGAISTTFNLPSDVGSLASVRLIGTLSYAFNAPQGQTVATLTVGAQTLPIRAGIELAERAFDRPSLRGLVQHQKAAVAFDFEDTTPEGEDYTAHLYVADLALSSLSAPQSITFTWTDPTVLVEIQGIAPVGADGVAHPLGLANRDGFQRLGDQVIQNTHALPRAYVLPRAQSFSPGRHPGLTATQLVASPDVDLHSMLLIEGDPATPQSPSGTQPAVAASRVEDAGPNRVRVTATAEAPSYLVLDDFYARGWTARVDGQPARVFIANALFRAVPIEPGAHEIEFSFEPLSHLVGAIVSVASLALAIGVMVTGYIRGRAA